MRYVLRNGRRRWRVSEVSERWFFFSAVSATGDTTQEIIKCVMLMRVVLKTGQTPLHRREIKRVRMCSEASPPPSPPTAVVASLGPCDLLVETDRQTQFRPAHHAHHQSQTPQGGNVTPPADNTQPSSCVPRTKKTQNVLSCLCCFLKHKFQPR